MLLRMRPRKMFWEIGFQDCRLLLIILVITIPTPLSHLSCFSVNRIVFFRVVLVLILVLCQVRYSIGRHLQFELSLSCIFPAFSNSIGAQVLGPNSAILGEIVLHRH